MKLFIFILSFLILAVGPTAEAQTQKLSMLEFDAKSLPVETIYKGLIIDGARWIDSNGENILLLTQTGAMPTPSSERACPEPDCDPSYSAELYAYHYVKKNGNVHLLWKTTDYERDCQFDLYVAFVPGSLFITDLNSDGIAESTFLYTLICRSDVSPGILKLIMHEGQTKYAIRGTTQLTFRFDDRTVAYDGGKMNIDRDLEKADPKLKAFAKKKWKQFVNEDNLEQRQF